MIQRPNVIGLLLCEQVVIEETTRNVTLVNSFTERVLRRSPSEGIGFCVFAVLVDGMGEVPLEVVILQLDNLDEMYRRAFVMRFVNPLLEGRMILRFRNVAFPAPGDYQVSLLAGKELIAQKKFTIRQQE